MDYDPRPLKLIYTLRNLSNPNQIHFQNIQPNLFSPIQSNPITQQLACRTPCTKRSKPNLRRTAWAWMLMSARSADRSAQVLATEAPRGIIMRGHRHHLAIPQPPLTSPTRQSSTMMPLPKASVAIPISLLQPSRVQPPFLLHQHRSITTRPRHHFLVSIRAHGAVSRALSELQRRPCAFGHGRLPSGCPIDKNSTARLAVGPSATSSTHRCSAIARATPLHHPRPIFARVKMPNSFFDIQSNPMGVLW